MYQKKLHITVGTAPDAIDSSGASRINLRNELNIVKAALLYADRVKLCSITSSIMLDGLNFRNFPVQKKIAFLEAFAQGMSQQFDTSVITEVVQRYRQAWKRRYSRNGRATLKTIETKLDELAPSLESKTDKLLRSSGGYGIVQAEESGLLEIHSFDDSLLNLFQHMHDNREWLLDYVNVVASSVSDASTYPLFDELMNRTIRTGIAAGFIPVNDRGVARGKEATLAAELFKHLPLFEEASIDEILDIRKELENPLVRFRSAMIIFSEKMKDAAWDENFPFDAEQVFNRDVAPAVLNIEEEVKANSYLKELARKWFDKPLLLTGGSALALAVSNLPLPSIAALAVGASLNTINAVFDTNKEWGAKQRAIEQNNMFFYYRASKIISEGSK
jgi:hypothetical protein